ncbi:hypothetical protein EDD11_009078 [Mortierella claussenii]|nr:hypothetical protein EDD11_009078 [Mortierella claussenii]
MIKKEQLASDQAVDLTSQKPAIQLFVRANAAAGRRWRLSPLSSSEHGCMTFTEIELAAFLHKRAELHPILRKLIGCTNQQRRLTQDELTRDWLQVQVPGVLIQRLIAPVIQGRLMAIACVDDRGKRPVLRQPSRLSSLRSCVLISTPPSWQRFRSRAYQEKGYFLRGSIKTDKYQLQLLAHKVRELSSVKFKRYRDDVLPNRLLTTTAGTSDFLTEVRNVFKTSADVERLLGCTPDETDKVSYLGLDLGQAFVVGAYGLLPQDKSPKIGKRWRHRQQKKCGSRGRRNRGSGKGKTKSVCRTRGERHINLAAKQKAVARLTLRHRTWMEQQKIADLKILFSQSTSFPEAAVTESLTTRTIEPSLLPLRGANASFADRVEYKKHRHMSKKARTLEFHRLADSLLRMVGGSIGEKRKEEDKIVIGIGMGRFTSTSRLSSLHGTFESYFIQKARALGYLVIGVHEYYTSKRCPKCQQFVAQTESIRCLYCSYRKKYCSSKEGLTNNFTRALYMHRDTMVGHNMVNILRSHVEQQQRPLYLHPVDKDGHYPWLERGSESAAQPDDAPTFLAASRWRW